jgi:DNA-binding transcriptional MerR regulator
MAAPTTLSDARQPRGEDAIWGIGELAAELDVTARAIRFYESKGLLSPRRVGTTRVYGRLERARLILILRGKTLGLSLRQIQEYLELYGERGSGRKKQLEHVVENTDRWLAKLEKKKQDLERTIAELRTIRRESKKKLARL